MLRPCDASMGSLSEYVPTYEKIVCAGAASAEFDLTIHCRTCSEDVESLR